MDNLSTNEVSEICNQLGKESPKSIKPVYGGSIHNAWQIEFKKEKFFVKRNERKQRFLKYEKYCLQNLKNYINDEDLIIPEVISYSEIDNVEILLTDWIDMKKGDQKKLGKGLGTMHLNSTESHKTKFGYEVEGYIGITTQKKGWEDSWIDCFINLRIKPQLSILKNNFLGIKIQNQICEKIKSELISHIPSCALVHGDLWSGNVGVNHKGSGVIFDPASWWADSEVDIAMTKLFGGFRNEFYEEYHKIIPRKDGFEKRETIYNFYHILNHANIFGGSYFGEVRNYLERILNF